MIIIIDNYDSFTYNLYQAVAKIYPQVQVIRNDKISVAEIMALNPAAVIISPGPGRPENAGIGVELIKTCYKKFPMLGICLGHQMMTIAFAGKVVLAKEAVHGKQTEIFHEGQGLYQDMSQPFRAGRYHSLIAERESLPACLIVEAEDKQGLIMGIRHRDYPVYGLQFHPESILTPEGDRIIKNFIQMIRP